MHLHEVQRKIFFMYIQIAQKYYPSGLFEINLRKRSPQVELDTSSVLSGAEKEQERLHSFLI